jgi:predicted PurR-regulated permease PerM
MKFIFKKNNKNSPAEGYDFRENLLKRFDEANLRLQYRCANWLERKTAHLSRKSWIVILFCFTVFTGGCSIYIMVNSFSANTTKSITITPISKPTNVVPFENETIQQNATITKAEFERIIRFREYMDSLGRSPTGKKLYDSIVQYRPGLLDSLAIVEHYYHSQFKK